MDRPFSYLSRAARDNRPWRAVVSDTRSRVKPNTTVAGHGAGRGPLAGYLWGVRDTLGRELVPGRAGHGKYICVWHE